MKKILTFVVLFLFLANFISATQITSLIVDEDDKKNSNMNQEQNQYEESEKTNLNKNESSEGKQIKIQEIIKTKNRLRIQNSEECPEKCTCTGSVTKCQLEEGREMTIQAGNSGNTIVQVKGVDMETKVTLYKSEDKVYGVFKNNETKEIKVLPDKVQTRLTEKIGGLEEHEIELGEDGTYNVQARKRAQLFGFIPVRERVRVEMNSETGEIIRTRTSWWGFLAKDEPIVGNTCGTVNPDSRDECCINKGYDFWNLETLECE